MTDKRHRSLYVPQLEHDSCGIGFVANLNGVKSSEIVQDALTMLENMEHRGACGCEANTGDGAGLLVQVPHRYLTEKCTEIGIQLPPFGGYGVGMIFFPKNKAKRERCKKIFNKQIDELGLELLGYRDVPVNNKGIGTTALSVEPKIEQVFIRLKNNLYAPEFLDRRIFVLRKYSTKHIHNLYPDLKDDFYISSLSYKTIVYKGQLRTDQVRSYYLDLQDEHFLSAMAMVHSRFSTNTFPKWKLAQPFDYIAHNGEINTIRGNINWMKAKEAVMSSTLFTPEEMEWMLPICDAARSDSGNLDSLVEMLVFGGRSIPHAMMMLIPEAWQEDSRMNDRKKAFYEYHASIMEPWDGPAAVCFTDGKVIGALLDRNGLRPARYVITDDDRLIMASEAGALPVDPSKIKEKGRIKPGKMFIADLEHGRIISDYQLKKEMSSQQPYREWLNQYKLSIDDIPEGKEVPINPNRSLIQRQKAFGYSKEDIKSILIPMALTGKEPIGSMGSDIPLAILSDKPQHLSSYFKQMFAQVSNPPIDPIRERLVMSLQTSISLCSNILSEEPRHCTQIYFKQPVIDKLQADKLRNLDFKDFSSKPIDTLFDASGKKGELLKAIDRICKAAEKAVKEGYNILFLTDRGAGGNKIPVPSLMATGAVHHHLIKKGLRTKAGIVVEAGDVWETHHFACIIGYGGNIVYPYQAFETINDLYETGRINSDLSESQLISNYVKAINEGLMKIMSKMGISTLQSYHGAQIFEALGIGSEVIEKCFTDTISRLDGLDFDSIASEQLSRDNTAFSETPFPIEDLEDGGVYAWRKRGEFHLFNPETIHLLQKSARNNDYGIYRKYAERINNQLKKSCTLRGLFEFKNRKSIPVEEVEPVENIFKRFATGAMSFGSISHEAHSTLAIAMNRIGGKSNSGEGGEDEARFEPKINGDLERSAIKQVASGRFGVTSNYLTNADELQIKIAQGAKPGEGGQLPGHKVDEWIGRVRHSTPGVGLISPPPHHDIYSIEDLAQLIFDLKNANRNARINVKLVSEAGVGTIAAGVAKAHADAILISGHDGGTGASPISSIRHAGLPWELGLAEAHQTLVKNNLRSRVVLQTDGQIRTGRDLAIATLLGAEEWGVATAALIVEGCIMTRKCHLNTCPVGIATQNPELRKLFTGEAEHVVNFFTFLAQDLREVMAELGFRTVNEMVGHADVLKRRDNIDHWKIKQLNLNPIFYKEPEKRGVGLYKQQEQDHNLENALDWKMLKHAQGTFQTGIKIFKEFKIKNTHRSVGALLSNEVSKLYGSQGLPDGTLHYKFRGSAGQSFGAFSTRGVWLELEGEANDYIGKGMSGARIIVYPDRDAQFDPYKNIIIGNVALYGATSGEAYIRGMAGERFAVRNSGVKAVVEAVGDHGCEYMTGGVVVVLGETGRNFAAGMSGGIALVYDPSQHFESKCNMEMIELEELTREDKLMLNQLIRNHYEYTKSQIAQHLLIYWKESLMSFRKVMPKDYKALLSKKVKMDEEKVLKKVI